MTDAEILDRWLCAKCYGRDVYLGFDQGIYSKVESHLASNTAIKINIGSESIDLFRRNTTKQASYVRDFFNNHGLIVGAIQDAQYVNFFRSKGDECWGDITDEYAGSYSITTSFKNSQIYFADLRDDILVYYEETGSYSGSGSGDKPIGQQLIYADFGGQGVGCKTIFIYDAIKLEVPIGSSGLASEKITLGNYTPYQQPNSGGSTQTIAASDNSGYCGGVSFGCFGFGTYAIVDQDEPFNCTEGSYTELISPESIFAFRNSWESSGTNTTMDSFDSSTWSDYTSGWDSNIYSGFADGIYDYPDFISKYSLPKGSWVTDYKGSYFYSMLTKDSKVFNKLNTEDPNNISNLKETGIVYYPAAPL